jgi:hypothetical protein
MTTKLGVKLCDTSGCLTNVKASQALCQKCEIEELKATRNTLLAQQKVQSTHTAQRVADISALYTECNTALARVKELENLIYTINSKLGPDWVQTLAGNLANNRRT